MSKVPLVTLNNGVKMPQLGLGVWQVSEGDEIETAVLTALECGYRLIDTAAVYGNETGLGQVLRAYGIPREELFVTSKVWNTDQGYEATLEACKQSIRRLATQYLDLYLIHWPAPRLGKFVETWHALEKLYEAGLVRAIGVSNFKPHHIKELLQAARIIPAVNQIELHPRLQQLETRAVCAEQGIYVESYSPLMRGGEILENSVIEKIAQKHGKTPAQVVLRWHIQNGLIVIPKSVTPERIRQNIDIFDFELSDGDMAQIIRLNEDMRIAPDPDTVGF